MKVTIARIKGANEYTWYQWTGNLVRLLSGRGKILEIKKGETFGLRPSSDKKKYRLVSPSLGLTHVFSLDQAGAKKMLAKAKPAKAGRASPVSQIEEEKSVWEISDVLPEARKAILDFARRLEASGVTEQNQKLLQKIHPAIRKLKDNESSYKKFLSLLSAKFGGRKLKHPKGWDQPLLGLAVRTLKKAAKNFDNLESTFIDFSDAHDYLKLAVLLCQGKEKQAAQFNANLDTAVYEEIPNKIWNYLRDIH